MKIFISAVLACTAVVSVCAQTVYPTGANGCIANWNFTSAGAPVTALSDVSGNNNNGSVYNLTPSANFRNMANRAMQFNGISSYAEVSSNTLLTPQNVSMVILVQLDTFYSGTCQNTQIISKGTSSFESGMYAMGVNDNVYDGNNCQSYSPGHQQLGANFHNASFVVPPGNYVDLHRWMLFVVCHNGNNARFYQVVMDTGNYVSNIAPFFTTTGFNASLGTNSHAVEIGRLDNALYPYWLHGKLDELVLFNNMLNTAEVQNIYDYLWGKVVIRQPFTDTVLCTGSSFTVLYAVGDHISSGNVFTAELSDANGSFANPLAIGSIVSNVSGNIPCSIPGSIVPGNGYRIRVTATDTTFDSRDNGVNIQIGLSGTPAVSISAVPDSITAPNQPIAFTATVTGGGANPSYQWRKNGVNIPGATANPFLTTNVQNNDAITVWVHSSAVCSFPDTALSSAFTVISTGIDDVQKPQLSVFPNPNKGIFTVTGFSVKSREVSFEVFNAMGGKVYQGTARSISSSNAITIKIKDELVSGLYLLKIENGDEVVGARFIIER